MTLDVDRGYLHSDGEWLEYPEAFRCAATTTRGARCKQHASEGHRFCVWHGGPRIGGTNLDRRKLIRANLGRQIGTLMQEMEESFGYRHPIHTLEEAIRKTEALMLIIGTEMERYQVFSDEFDRLRMWYGHERDRLARFSKFALDAGIDERRVQLQEFSGRALSRWLEKAIHDPAVGMTQDQIRALGPALQRAHAELQREAAA